MSFSLNQATLNNAIASALPSLLKELEFDYVSGRAPKGLQATATVTEPMIRKAVEQYARRTVNASFNHIGISFQATRGEDGIIANITASNAPIEPEDEAPARAAAQPAAEPASEPTDAVEDAPFAEDETNTDVEVTAEATASEVAADEGDASAATPAPAATRSKLFAGLARPDNSAAASE